VCGISLLPSVYAWYTIDANFNPYDNTKNLNIAVANNDAGAWSEYTQNINIGDEVAATLAKNDELGWQFCSTKDAISGVNSGEFYAAIIIPDDFSESLLSVFSGEIKHAQIDYYVNEKISDSAVKVTNAGANKVETSINEVFKNTVAKKLIEIAQAGGHEAIVDTDNASATLTSDILKAKTNIALTTEAASQATPAIDKANAALTDASNVIASAKESLPQLANQLESCAANIEELEITISDYSISATSAISKAAIAQAKAASKAILTTLTVQSDINNAHASTTSALDKAKNALEKIESTLNEDNLGNASDDLESQMQTLSSSINAIQTASDDLTQAADRLADLGASAETDSTKTANAMADAAQKFSTQTVPSIIQTLDKTRSALLDGANACNSATRACMQIESAITQAHTIMNSLETFTSNAATSLKDTESKLGSIEDDIEIIQNAQTYHVLQNFLNADPTKLADFLASPVSIDTHTVFPMSSYGASVAPFFSNVALWVAGFLLMSLIRLRVDPEGLPHFTTRQAYFGRLMFFLFVGIIQACGVCIGELAIGVTYFNVPAFFIAAIVAEIAYINIMYALEYTLRHVGRALAVVLLIMQIPGAGGMYPIQMMPQFYQAINPLLPFTHSIDAMREAIGGFYGLAYFGDLAILLFIYAPIGLIIGLIGSKACLNLNLMFDKKLGETGLFIAEKVPKGTRRIKTRTKFEALQNTPSYQTCIRKQAKFYNKHYRQASLVGWLLLVCIFIAITSISLITHATANEKLTLLVIFIACTAMLAIYQVVLAYLKTSAEVNLSKIQNNPDVAEGNKSTNNALKTNMKATKQQSLLTSSPSPSFNNASTTYTDASTKKQGFIKKVFAIYIEDLNRIKSNAIAFVVTVGLVIVPPMYAWLTTLGFWDPYANTDNLAIAVVNEDVGYKSSLYPAEVNTGDRIVSELHENSSFKWEFVNYNNAMQGIDNGEYYAAIVIPADFSSNLLGALDADDDQATIDYYVNQKLNPVAPHITGIGATDLQTKLDEQFTNILTSVSLGIYDNLNTYLGSDNNVSVSSSATTTEGIFAYAARLANEVSSAANSMDEAGRTISELGDIAALLSEIAKSSSSTLATYSDVGNDTNEVLAETYAAIQSQQSTFDSCGDILASTLKQTASDCRNLKSRLTDYLQDSANASKAASTAITHTAQTLKEQSSTIDALKNSLQQNGANQSTIDALATAAASLNDAANDLKQASLELDEVSNTSKAAIDKITNDLETTAKSIETIADSLKTEVDAKIAEITQALEDQDSKTYAITKDIDNATSDLTTAMDSTASAAYDMAASLKSTGENLTKNATELQEMATKLQGALNSGDIAQIKQILGQNSQALANFLAAPTTLQTHAVYPIANNGSSMSAFYTSLSLWIGAIFLVALTDAAVSKRRLAQIGGATPRESYFGRYLTFATIACLQAITVSFGNLFLLGIQCVHPVYYVLVCLVCSIVFSNIVYTLTLALGNIGKAIAIILMVMQLGGAGGIFPIQMSSPIFQAIYPWLPFAHSMEAMQSCIAGIYGTQLITSIGWLGVFLLGSLIIGLLLRRPILHLNDFIEEKLEETKLL
jgi:putative membrane protein